MSQPVLEVRELTKHFPVKIPSVRRLFARFKPVVHAVDGVSFEVGRGEILGLVGESGCGKTTTGRVVLRLLEPTSGRIMFEGVEITHMKESELRPLRPRMQIVFQDPHAALNPAMTIGQAIMDPLLIHETADEAEAKDRALLALEEVGLAPAKDLFSKYPADLSGGQKQRAVLARAIILHPSLIVADEPVAMLDMSIRARILELLLELRKRHGLAYLFITHDLATAKFVCDRIAIMYLGRIVETGPTQTIFRDPKHPYTRALLAAIPVPVPGRVREKGLPRGEVPDAIFPPAGCRFHPRCPAALPTCGWEGRDFVDFLEQRHLDPELAKVDDASLGPVEAWRAALGECRLGRIQDPRAAATYVLSILGQAPRPFAQAITGVDVEDGGVVVRFRAPDPLGPKEVEGRMVECLLY